MKNRSAAAGGQPGLRIAVAAQPFDKALGCIDEVSIIEENIDYWCVASVVTTDAGGVTFDVVEL